VKNESNPVIEWFRAEDAFYNYAFNMRLTKPFFIRALEACATLDGLKKQEEKNTHPG
jgi:hypothetical protein